MAGKTKKLNFHSLAMAMLSDAKDHIDNAQARMQVMEYDKAIEEIRDSANELRKALELME